MQPNPPDFKFKEPQGVFTDCQKNLNAFVLKILPKCFVVIKFSIFFIRKKKFFLQDWTKTRKIWLPPVFDKEKTDHWKVHKKNYWNE